LQLAPQSPLPVAPGTEVMERTNAQADTEPEQNAYKNSRWWLQAAIKKARRITLLWPAYKKLG